MGENRFTGNGGTSAIATLSFKIEGQINFWVDSKADIIVEIKHHIWILINIYMIMKLFESEKSILLLVLLR